MQITLPPATPHCYTHLLLERGRGHAVSPGLSCLLVTSSPHVILTTTHEVDKACSWYQCPHLTGKNTDAAANPFLSTSQWPGTCAASPAVLTTILLQILPI